MKKANVDTYGRVVNSTNNKYFFPE